MCNFFIEIFAEIFANRNLKLKFKVLKCVKGLSIEQLPMNSTHAIYLLQIHLIYPYFGQIQ